MIVKPKTKQFMIHIDENLHKELKIEAATNNTSISKIILDLLKKRNDIK